MSGRLPDDRGAASPVGGGRRWFRSAKGRRIAMACGGMLAFVLFILGLNAALHEEGFRERTRDPGYGTISQTTITPVEPERMRAPIVPPPPIVVNPAAVSTPAFVPVARDFVVFPASSGEMHFDVPPPVIPAKKEAGSGGSPDKDSETQVAFKGRDIAGGKVGKAIRMTYVMRPQAIPCALDTAMDSTLAGAIFCHTTAEVRSQENVLLMPVRTQIVGTYKSDTRRGQARLFSFAGSAITKEGIPVPLDSGVADGLGRTGIPGDVDHHYGERFGAAIALTGVQSMLGIAQAAASQSGSTNLQFNSGGGPGDLATEILRQQSAIQDTISVPPGAEISIIVDHPIDFSPAIKVRTVE